MEPGRQFKDVEVDGNVARVQRGDYHVMVLNHGDYGTTAHASHRPEGEDGITVGEAMFKNDGTLDNIGVSPQHQRRGVGTAIWDAASALAASGGMPEPRHAVERTDAGDAWAKKVGGRMPAKRQRVYRN